MPWTPLSASVSSWRNRPRRSAGRRRSLANGPRRRLVRAVALALCALFLVPVVGAGPVNISGSFGSFNLKPKSLHEMRWDTVVRQQYDFSCGSAAVATLLTYHYDRPTSEDEVFKAMIAVGDRAKIQAQGFSMLDMKRYLDEQGLNSDGFRMTLDAIVKIGVPGITLVDTQGYKHFVVVKGIDNDTVLVGDPAVGAVAISKERFESIWNGAVLAAREDIKLARAHFNSKEDWKIRPSAPIGRGIRRASIGTMLLTLPGPNELGK